MVKKLLFKINPDGSTEMKVEGVAGASCEEFSRPFEEALGEVTTRERTDDYWKEEEDLDQEQES